MIVKNNPITNADRINEIARLRLHEPIVDEILNEYTSKAAQEFNLPISLVSIVLDEAQHFVASHGLEGWIKEINGTPVEWSFCAYSVKSEQPFIVEDAAVHEKVKDNPLVTVDNIQCYAGVPLTTKNGYVVGNFCVIGDSSRSFTQEEVEKLQSYASQVMKHIESRITS